MKSSRVRRVSAAIALAGLIASCGGGTESSDTTERTRNLFEWSATTEASKTVVYGTQDGLVQYFDLLPASVTVSPTLIAEVTPNSLRPNGVVSVAVDTASSEVMFAGIEKSGAGYISRTDLDGNSKEVFTSPNLFVFGMGYDPASRTAVLAFDDGGSSQYLLHQVDEVNSPVFQSNISYVMSPVYSGKDFVVAKGDQLRNIDITNFKTVNASTNTLSSPLDVWGFAGDTKSSLYYGARQQAGQIVTMDLTKTNPISKVATVTNPASLAVFSDGTIVVGTGQDPTKTTGVVGGITVLDPTGSAAPVTLKGTGSGASSTGVQSVWAVESPIATAAPSVSLDSSGTLTCTDATWREDLPLSRLSRSPIPSVREYAWFKSGSILSGTSGETFVPTEEGKYSCAVTAANIGGIGSSDLSVEIAVDESRLSSSGTIAPTTSVSSGGSEPVVTSPSSGGAEAVPGESPVVTIPDVATGAPIAVVTPTLRSAKWTFNGRTAKITFKKWSGASKYRFYVRGATRKNIVCKTAKTTVTCSTTSLKKGLNTFSAKALSRSGITLALSTKTRNTK
jgi:hypothetical protein